MVCLVLVWCGVVVCGLACVLSGCPGEGCVTLLGALPDRLVYVHRAQDARSGTVSGARGHTGLDMPDIGAGCV